MFDLSNPDLTTYTSADGTLNGPHTAREIRSFSGTPWCIRFDGVNYTSTNGFYIQWDLTAGNAVYINEDVGATGAWLVYNQPYQQVYVWPPNATPTSPPAPSSPSRPTGLPDLPAGTDCSVASLETVCGQLTDLAADLQHVFASLGSATNQRADNMTDLDGRLTSIATGVSSNASQLVTIEGKEDAIKAEVDSLLPLVESTISADLGCPASTVSGHLLAFLPSALAALSRAECPSGGTATTPVAISGSGSTAIPSGAYAVIITVGSIPTGLSHSADTPAEWEGLGKIAFGTSSGLRPAIAISRAAALFDIPKAVDVVHHYLLGSLAGTISFITA